MLVLVSFFKKNKQLENEQSATDRGSRLIFDNNVFKIDVIYTAAQKFGISKIFHVF